MESKLVCTNPSKTIGMSELKSNVTYTHCINSDEDLQPGQVSSAQIMFTTTYSGLTKNSVITYSTKQYIDSNWRQMGVFYVREITKNRNDYTIVAYDSVVKFDRDVSSFLETTTASTIYDLYDDLCTYCAIYHYRLDDGGT